MKRLIAAAVMCAGLVGCGKAPAVNSVSRIETVRHEMPSCTVAQMGEMCFAGESCAAWDSGYDAIGRAYNCHPKQWEYDFKHGFIKQ